MTTLVGTMLPIFGLLVLGFVAVRLKLMDQPGVRGLVLFVFNFSIPSLLFTSMAELAFPAEMRWGFLLAFYGSSFALYAAGFAIGGFVFGRSVAERAIFGMTASFSNLALMGIPIVLTALGPEASLPMLIIIGFHSATFMPLTVILIQAGTGEGGAPLRRIGRVLADVAQNPIILGIFAGLVVNVSGVPVWAPLRSIFDLLGAAAVPCALFAMGASVATYPVRGEVGPAVTLSLMKLVLHPLLVWLIAVPVLGLSGLWVSVAILLAAMPSAVNVYLFGERYGVAAGVASRAVFLTTMASLVTISITLALIGA